MRTPFTQSTPIFAQTRVWGKSCMGQGGDAYTAFAFHYQRREILCSFVWLCSSPSSPSARASTSRFGRLPRMPSLRVPSRRSWSSSTCRPSTPPRSSLPLRVWSSRSLLSRLPRCARAVWATDAPTLRIGLALPHALARRLVSQAPSGAGRGQTPRWPQRIIPHLPMSKRPSNVADGVTVPAPLACRRRL